jgi:hypothetical protein
VALQQRKQQRPVATAYIDDNILTTPVDAFNRLDRDCRRGSNFLRPSLERTGVPSPA